MCLSSRKIIWVVVRKSTMPVTWNLAFTVTAVSVSAKNAGDVTMSLLCNSQLFLLLSQNGRLGDADIERLKLTDSYINGTQVCDSVRTSWKCNYFVNLYSDLKGK